MVCIVLLTVTLATLQHITYFLWNRWSQKYLQFHFFLQQHWWANRSFQHWITHTSLHLSTLTTPQNMQAALQLGFSALQKIAQWMSKSLSTSKYRRTRKAQQTGRISSLITHMYRHTQTHSRTAHQLQMWSSGSLRLTFLSSFWLAGCASLLWLSEEGLPLVSVCLSSSSFCWLAPDRGEPRGRGSGCWTPLWTSIFLCSALKRKSKMVENEAGKGGWIRQVVIDRFVLTTLSPKCTLISPTAGFYWATNERRRR